MVTSTEQNLWKAATAFREALVACPKDKFSAFQRKHLANLPTEACDLASLLLAYFLRDRGFQKIERVFGYLNDKSHVWLEVDGFIVDITPSQFAGIDDPIIVTDSASHSWHSCFCVEGPGDAYPLEVVRTEYEISYAEN